MVDVLAVDDQRVSGVQPKLLWFKGNCIASILGILFPQAVLAPSGKNFKLEYWEALKNTGRRF